MAAAALSRQASLAVSPACEIAPRRVIGAGAGEARTNDGRRRTETPKSASRRRVSKTTEGDVSSTLAALARLLRSCVPFVPVPAGLRKSVFTALRLARHRARPRLPRPSAAF
jgi:hypothetical protein